MTTPQANATLTQPQSSPVVKRSAPYETADIFLMHIYPGEERLIHYRDNFYQWSGSHYREVECGEMRSRLYAFLNRAIVLTPTGQTMPFCPDKHSVDKVVDALKAVTRIDSRLQAPAWMADAKRHIASEHEAADLLPCTKI